MKEVVTEFFEVTSLFDVVHRGSVDWVLVVSEIVCSNFDLLSPISVVVAAAAAADN